MQCLFYDLQCKYKQISASHDIHSFRSKGGFYIQASRFHKLAQVNAILKLILWYIDKNNPRLFWIDVVWIIGTCNISTGWWERLLLARCDWEQYTS